MAEGWFRLNRSWRDDDLFQGEFSKGEAWLWLMEYARWRDTPHNIKGKFVTIRRGQVCASRDRLAAVWGWAPSRVERFLTKLKTRQWIERETGQGKSIITICIYDELQGNPNETGQEIGQKTKQETGPQKNKQTIEQGSSVADATGAEALAAPVLAYDLVKVLFDTGVAILTAAGLTSAKARSIIGRWRKDYSDGQVLAALSRCQSEQPTAPVEWIARALQAETRGPRQQHNFRNNGRPPSSQRLPTAEDFAASGMPMQFKL